jgi:hypothetical protein
MDNTHEFIILENEFREIGFCLVSNWDGRMWGSPDFDIRSDGHSTRIKTSHDQMGTKEMKLPFNDRESLCNLLGLEPIN